MKAATRGKAMCVCEDSVCVMIGGVQWPRSMATRTAVAVPCEFELACGDRGICNSRHSGLALVCRRSGRIVAESRGTTCAGGERRRPRRGRSTSSRASTHHSHVAVRTSGSETAADTSTERTCGHRACGHSALGGDLRCTMDTALQSLPSQQPSTLAATPLLTRADRLNSAIL